MTWDNSEFGATGTVFGRAFTAAADSSSIFVDGFESGDVTAWTTSSQ